MYIVSRNWPKINGFGGAALIMFYSSRKQTRQTYNFQTTLLMNEPPAIEIVNYIWLM